MFVSAAEMANDGDIGHYCGIEHKSGKLVIVAGEADQIPALLEEFSFVTDDKGAAIQWLTEPSFGEVLRFRLEDFRRAEAAGDSSAAFAAADRLIATVSTWLAPCEPVLSLERLESSQASPNEESDP